MDNRAEIEKAVRELGGDYTKATNFREGDSDYLWYVEGYGNDYQALNKNSGYMGDYICTRDQFNHVTEDYRRLYGWAKFNSLTFEEFIKSDAAVKVVSDDALHHDFQWRTEYKPESSSKPEDDNWYKRGQLPPAGEVCLAPDPSCVEERVKSKIVHITKKGVVMYETEHGDSGFAGAPGSFRPLPTERDKLIASAEAVIEQATSEPANSRHLGILYDAGMLTPPTSAL